MASEDGSFFEEAREARRLLVLDLGFLGDTVHLMPALHEIRRAWPEATIDVMAEERAKQILEVVPGLNDILGYPRFPKGPKWHQDLGRVRRLRARSYDAVINLNGSDRSSILTRASGARWRLGRVPPKPAAFWRRCFTHVVDVPHGGRPVFQQRWECLKAAGIPVGEAPKFDVRIPDAVEAAVDLKLDGASDFIHVSPCTTQDMKELPMVELAAVVEALIERGRVVLSCAPNDRERRKMTELVESLTRPPWRTYAGSLSLLELAAVIGRARLHLGGDSGALHLALMMQTPTVSWFRNYPGKAEWLPPGNAHHAVVGEESPHGLRGVSAASILSAIDER